MVLIKYQNANSTDPDELAHWFEKYLFLSTGLKVGILNIIWISEVIFPGKRSDISCKLLCSKKLDCTKCQNFVSNRN